MQKNFVVGFVLMASLFTGCVAFEKEIEHNNTENKQSVEKLPTIKDLVESLWEEETGRPSPNYSYCRKVFKAESNNNNSLAEKINILYRSMELRRGFRLVKIRNAKSSYNWKKFEKSTVCGKMVSYLAGKTISEEDFIEYLVQQEIKKIEDSEDCSLELQNYTRLLSRMTLKEQVACLYQKQKLKNKRWQQRKDKTRAKRNYNEPGKPPQKPYRVNINKR